MALIVLAVCGPASIVAIYWLGAIRGERTEAEQAEAEQDRVDAEFIRIITALERQ
ncbi:hypothetical protein [Streptomyces sp. LS1784]|uniref:hypothetical protein n=1 Tax=Streptomyces sp. LS1784 TaxID=2851533 RepID=UPI001CCB2F5B|nr:hypothetical protein [Streptomyces sp. LS1784]